MVEVPKGIGKGEGGGKLPKLEETLNELVAEIEDLKQRIDALEGA